MQLSGCHLIGKSQSAEGEQAFNAIDPQTGAKLEPEFRNATATEVDRAFQLADAAFDAYRALPPETVAGFVRRIAQEIEALGDALIERARQETGLPEARLVSERGRTVNQARLFADLTEEGSFIDARIDHGDPDRKPLPKPDVRRMLMPLGPVAVFGASNFPLAISVAGSDTVSALCAGCPVVVKAHPAHPGTSELVAGAILKAAAESGIPDGVLSLVHGASPEVGLAMVNHPLCQAVAFTGSLAGGRALFDAGAKRPRPIPVYAEMGSTNPVFLLPGALKERARAIANGYIQSVNLGVGQFCTNPGLVFGEKGPALEAFTEAARQAAADVAPACMLHAGIRRAFDQGLERMTRVAGVRVVGRAKQAAETNQGACAILATDLETFLGHPELAEEVFGPSSLIVSCTDDADLERVALSLDGHLTATLHGTPEDLMAHQSLVRKLERKVGRLIFNGFPTGIEVCAAMHHGGPYPATTDPHFTSIGTASISRFVRPICYQGFPDPALPEPLQGKNQRGRHRLVDNRLTRDDA